MSDTLDETLPAHAPLGPSSAEGWSTCSDYVNANRGLPDFTIEPAAEGTAAHSVSDICLMTGLDPDELIGMVTEVAGFSFSWDEEDARLLAPGIADIRATGAQFYGEHRVDISPWTIPGQFGTLDRASVLFDEVEQQWWVVVEDLKWGRGIAVSPVENKQIMLYALGFYQAVGRHLLPEGAVPKFRLMIDQPRHMGGGGVWETTLDDLLAFGDWIKGRAALTTDPDAPRTASLKGCMWCRRRRVPGISGGCDTFDTYMIDVLGHSWDDIDIGIMMETDMATNLPRALTPERRSYILEHKDSIRRWLDEMEKDALDDAHAGRPTGGQKLVLGRKGADSWKDKDRAARYARKVVGDSAFKEVLRTPTQLGKEVDGKKARILGRLTKRGERKPELAPLADARSAITTAQSQFEPEAE